MRHATCLLAGGISIFCNGGCSRLATTPSHPDSFGTASLLGPSYFMSADNCIAGAAGSRITGRDLQCQMWSTQKTRFAPSNNQQAYFDYIATPLPFQIWQARGQAWNMHLRYLAASYKAADVQDQLAVPVFGAAVAVVASGIASLGATAVASAGLSGGVVQGGTSYLHPGADAAAERTAASALLCVVNRSEPFIDLNVVQLLLDRAALEDTLVVLKSTSNTGATKKASDAAEKAGDDALTALNKSINAYSGAPEAIRETMASIDDAARTGGARTLDYSKILSDLKASAASTPAKADAAASVNKSKTATMQAKAAGGTKGAMTRTSLFPDATTATVGGDTAKPLVSRQSNLAALVDPDDGDALLPGIDGADVKTAKIAPATSPGAAAADPNDPMAMSAAPSPSPASSTHADVSAGRAGSGLSAVKRLTQVENNTGTTTLDKINAIAFMATQDIPSPDYSDVAANVRLCVGGGTSPSTAGSTGPSGANGDSSTGSTAAGN